MSHDELQELHDAVCAMSRVGNGAAGAAAQERVIQALSMARKALEVPTLRFVGEEAYKPTRSHTNDAGYDLYVAESVRLRPGDFQDVSLGIAVEFPPGWWGRIIGRSSTFRNLSCLVIEGIIDEGFRGELFAGVRNLSFDDVIELNRGDRVCQLILHRTPPTMPVEQVETLAPSDRGSNGFGSTGR